MLAFYIFVYVCMMQPFFLSSFLNRIEAHLSGYRIDSIPKRNSIGLQYCVNQCENDAQKSTITVIGCISMCGSIPENTHLYQPIQWENQNSSRKTIVYMSLCACALKTPKIYRSNSIWYVNLSFFGTTTRNISFEHYGSNVASELNNLLSGFYCDGNERIKNDGNIPMKGDSTWSHFRVPYWTVDDDAWWESNNWTSYPVRYR